MQALGDMHGRDAFHRVPIHRPIGDAVERVPTRGGALGERALPRFLACGIWPALPATRAVARTHTHNKERY
jgi:hypothetical protein